MVFAKLALDCAADVPGSPVLTAIARNGVEVGIRVSGTGDQWFVGPAALPDPAKLFDGYAPADMNPDLGDSAIVETYGLGALAVAASPVAAALGRAGPGRRSTRSTRGCGRSRPASRRTSASRTAAPRSSASTPARSPRRGSRRPCTPGSRTAGRGSARSAAASRTRRCRRSTSRSRRCDPRRGGPPRPARGAARGRVPVRAAAGRGAARGAVRDQPDAGPRGAAAAGGRRARRARPLGRRAAERAAGVGDARALRRPHRARGPGRAHGRPGAPATACTRSGWSCATSTTRARTSCTPTRRSTRRCAAGNRAAERYLRDINERIRVIRIHDFTTPDRIEATIRSTWRSSRRSGSGAPTPPPR